MSYVIQYIPEKDYYLNRMEKEVESQEFPVWKEGIENAILFENRDEAEEMLKSLSHKNGKIIQREGMS